MVYPSLLVGADPGSLEFGRDDFCVKTFVRTSPLYVRRICKAKRMPKAGTRRFGGALLHGEEIHHAEGLLSPSPLDCQSRSTAQPVCALNSELSYIDPDSDRRYAR